jgi:hypothetical protein
MEKIDLETSKYGKMIVDKVNAIENDFNVLKENVELDVKNLKDELETINKKRNLKQEIVNAYNTLRLDAIMGMARISVSKLRELKGYMENIDYDNIPKEIKKYMEVEK